MESKTDANASMPEGWKKIYEAYPNTAFFMSDKGFFKFEVKPVLDLMREMAEALDAIIYMASFDAQENGDEEEQEEVQKAIAALERFKEWK